MNRPRRKPSRNLNPTVFVGKQTGDQYATFCNLGTRVIKRVHRFGETGCGTVACACGAEEDTSFHPATEPEAGDFWLAMEHMAADATRG